MTILVSYLKAGGLEGVSRFVGEAKISPEADAVSVVASQATWDILTNDLTDATVRSLLLDTANDRNVASDGSKISLKEEEGSTAVAEYIFKNPLPFQAFHLLVTSSSVAKTEIHRAPKKADTQKAWKWSANLK